MIELRKLTKKFGAFTAVDGLDLRSGSVITAKSYSAEGIIAAIKEDLFFTKNHSFG